MVQAMNRAAKEAIMMARRPSKSILDIFSYFEYPFYG